MPIYATGVVASQYCSALPGQKIENPQKIPKSVLAAWKAAGLVSTVNPKAKKKVVPDDDDNYLDDTYLESADEVEDLNPIDDEIDGELIPPHEDDEPRPSRRPRKPGR